MFGQGSTSERHEYQFIDKAVQPGMTYVYRLGDVDYSGKVTWHGEVEVKVEVEQVPQQFKLAVVYPNPFNPVATIGYDLPEATPVQIRIYDLSGREVAQLVDEFKPAGSYQNHWEPVNLPTGTYLVKIQAGRYQQTQKCLLIK